MYFSAIIFDCDGTLFDPSKRPMVLYPGIKVLLHALNKHSQLFIWTGRDKTSLSRLLVHQQLEGVFQAWHTADDSYPKPHPRGFLEFLPPIDGKKICVIGDSYVDVEVAKQAGFVTIGALWNTESQLHRVAKTSPDFLATSPEECLKWLMNYSLNA